MGNRPNRTRLHVCASNPFGDCEACGIVRATARKIARAPRLTLRTAPMGEAERRLWRAEIRAEAKRLASLAEAEAEAKAKAKAEAEAERATARKIANAKAEAERAEAAAERRAVAGAEAARKRAGAAQVAREAMASLRRDWRPVYRVFVRFARGAHRITIAADGLIVAEMIDGRAVPASGAVHKRASEARLSAKRREAAAGFAFVEAEQVAEWLAASLARGKVRK